MARIPILSALSSLFRRSDAAAEGDPLSEPLLSAIRGGQEPGGRSLPEAPAWFAASVLSRLRREEAERAERFARRRRLARVLIPSGLLAAFLLVLGIGEHQRTVAEQDQVTFAAFEELAKGQKSEGGNGGDGAPRIVEGVSWSTP